MRFLSSTAASWIFACVTAVSCQASTITFAGDLSVTDLRFNRPSSASSLSGVGTAVAYDLYSFVASTGPYSVNGDYRAGGIGDAAGLDGYLFLYQGSFNPASPLTNLRAADDDNDPDGGGAATALDGSLIASAGSYGPGTTTTTLTLTPGLTYWLVVAGFNNTTVADGLGAYTLTVTGADAAVPEPGTFALMGSALLGLGLLRRRKR